MIEIYLKTICRYNYHIDAIVEKLEIPVQLAGKTVTSA